MEEITEAEIKQADIEAEIIKLLKSTKRDGILPFIDFMYDQKFFTAPCSGGNHLCKTGGLAEHSLNVCKMALKLAKAADYTDKNSIIIASLLHDFGKTGDYEKELYVDNILKSGKPSSSKPFKRNPAILEKNHAVKSVVLLNRWIDLTEDEEYAILHHDGFYERSNYEAMQSPTPLLLLIHTADLWCCKFIEDKGNEVEE